MLFSRYAVARLLATASLIAVVSAGSPPSVTTPAIGAASQAALATASLSGTVRASASQAPIPRARVTLVSQALGTPRVTIASAEGRFAFDRLPAGSYTVQASASGYAAQAHGQRPNGSPAPVMLAAGQQLSQIDIELVQAGVIVGRILDEDQRPFVGASVDALAPRMENQQATLVSLANTVTDDRGEFRLAGLPEGHYYVSAFDPAFADVGDSTGPLRYTATYYPGVVFVEEARRVSVAPGADPNGTIVFALKIVRPAQVSGIIATPDRRQLLNGAVIMSPVHGESHAAVPSDDVRIDPDGRFAFRNVAPGNYQIRARAQTDPDGVALFAAYRVVVNGRDIDNVEMALLPGGVVEGTVVFETRQSPSPGTFAGLRVRAPFVDGSTFGDAITGDVGADGRYRIRGVMAGRHYLTVEGLRDPWVIKEVSWRGQDVTDSPIDINAKQVLEHVRITLTDLANDVSGTVKDARGRPVADALVLVVPAAPQMWTRANRRFAVRRTDGDGRYRARGLPAGEYRILASVDFDESEVYRQDFLRELEDEGQPLTLGAPQAHVVDLRLTSLARLKRPTGR